MTSPARRILATSGGFVPDGRYGAVAGPLIHEALRLSGADRPAVCLMNTATGDDPARYALGYAALARLGGVDASHLALFPMPSVPDVRAHLLAQDVVWVGGGSVANLLAVWRAHGLAEVMREAWEAGVVLAGVSAGSLCWFAGGTTDSFGPDLRPVEGLGLLPHGNCPHYDSEARRRPLFQQLVADGACPAGWATDDGVGLVFEGVDLVEAVGDRPGAAAWHVTAQGGRAVEQRVEPRLLAGGTRVA